MEWGATGILVGFQPSSTVQDCAGVGDERTLFSVLSSARKVLLPNRFLFGFRSMRKRVWESAHSTLVAARARRRENKNSGR